MSMQNKSLDTKNALLLQDVFSLESLGLPTLEERPLVPEAFAMVIRALLQNGRQGTVACKNRSQVSGSNKKPWKQKGTGRARAGAVTSPLWRGGGIIFGPQPRTRTLKVTRAARKGALQDLVRNFITRQRVFVADWNLDQDVPKTKEAFKVIASLGVKDKMVNVFLPFEDQKLVASFSNIPNVRIVFFDAANAYVLSDAHCWLVFKKDVDAFKNMVAQWI